MKKHDMKSPTNLKSDSQTHPLGLDNARPRLSWQLPNEQRNLKQQAWQIMVASTADLLAQEKPDLWDSGKREDLGAISVPYEGSRLASRQRCHWKVRIWDQDGAASPWSETAWFEMALLEPSDWQAQWIGGELVGGPRTSAPCPFLRREFELAAPVVRARLYVSALGLYEARLNGVKVGDHCLTPGWTDYHKRVLYQVYDVTALLKQGKNAAGMILGDGWYCGYVGFFGRRQIYGDRPWGLWQLEVLMANGERCRMCTDESWKVAYGPILESDLLMGESIDARREMPGWDLPGFNEGLWRPVSIRAALQYHVYVEPITGKGEGEIRLESDMGEDKAQRVAHTVGQIASQEILRPVGKPWVRPGNFCRHIFDFGQNMVGVVRLRLKGPRGTTAIVRHAEMLEKEGVLHTANLDKARATDSFTLSGEGVEVFEPRFTYHGFRYIEVSAPMKEKLEVVEVEGIVRHSEMPVTGVFECSESKLNQLQSNINWSVKGNFVSVPTDCPQRSERMGWGGDSNAIAKTAAFNRDVHSFYAKWLDDLADAQGEDGRLPMWCPLGAIWPNDGGPSWSDTYLMSAWTLYQVYGDIRMLERHYDSLKRYMDFLIRTSRDGIRNFKEYDGHKGFGDWLALDGSNSAWGGTPFEVIGTAYFAKAADLMARIAGALGRNEDAQAYRALYHQARTAFQQAFVGTDGKVIGNTQTAHVLPLSFDLLDGEMNGKAVANLVRLIEENGDCLGTGCVGTSLLLHALSRHGRVDVAYRLLFQEKCPSWLFPVTQGATTIWERWDSYTIENGIISGMNSFNHYAFGAVGEWMYENIAGIAQANDSIAYEKIVVHPRPIEKLQWAKGRLDTVRGTITTDWKLDGDQFSLDVTIPPNAAATVVLPTKDLQSIVEDDKPLSGNDAIFRAAQQESYAAKDGSEQLIRVRSGQYRFRCLSSIRGQVTRGKNM